jgi:2-polyprenyl-3-methyl-5-hydroxy-6-metoxy-1,4-benzoquinol methylase
MCSEVAMEPKGHELVKRYKANYAIQNDGVVTEEMILKHWALEKSLREELLRSTPDTRWEVFEHCYSRLYRELAWLNQLEARATSSSPSVHYATWIDVIGSPPLNIYEIGSGKGDLIHYLATCGFRCKGSEITRERGQSWSKCHPNLSWGISDGVHLEQFEPEGVYDVVISDQVIEHLHPDDLLDHFRGVFEILSIGGRYIFSTPHISVGPSDISRVFQSNRLMGMHLKEYTYSELVDLLGQTGFKQLQSIIRLPAKFRRSFGSYIKPVPSTSYLTYLCLLEKLFLELPTQKIRQMVSRASKAVLFSPNMMVIASK